MRPGASEFQAPAGDPAAQPWSGVLVEAVAHRAHGGDRRDAVRRRELASQVTDVDVDDIGLAPVLVAPHRLQELLAAEHLALVAQHVDQKVELGARERYRIAL